MTACKSRSVAYSPASPFPENDWEGHLVVRNTMIISCGVDLCIEPNHPESPALICKHAVPIDFFTVATEDLTTTTQSQTDTHTQPARSFKQVMLRKMDQL